LSVLLIVKITQPTTS